MQRKLLPLLRKGKTTKTQNSTAGTLKCLRTGLENKPEKHRYLSSVLRAMEGNEFQDRQASGQPEQPQTSVSRTSPDDSEGAQKRRQESPPSSNTQHPPKKLEFHWGALQSSPRCTSLQDRHSARLLPRRKRLVGLQGKTACVFACKRLVTCRIYTLSLHSSTLKRAQPNF